MMIIATGNISLSEQMKAWIYENVQSGLYANASDNVRDHIRKDTLKKEALRQALIDGKNSGPSRPFDGKAFLNKLLNKHFG